MEADRVNGNHHEDPQTEKKKKKKKRKRSDAIDNDANGSVANGHAGKASKKKQKKAKKGKKSKATGNGTSEAEAQRSPKRRRVNGDETNGEKKAKKERKEKKEKKAKKKRKHNEEEEAQSRADASHASLELSKYGARLTPEQQKRTEAFRSKESISVQGVSEDTSFDFAPLLTLDEARKVFPAPAMAACAEFQRPTPIQAQCWPVLAAGRDVIGIAETGSGKTHSFLVPALSHVLSLQASSSSSTPATTNNPSALAPWVLIIAPTRELAMQTADICAGSAGACGASSICLYGGVNKGEQKRALRSSPNLKIVVATPGRLIDLVDERSLDLSRVSYFVLDEADRMLDLGFEPDVRKIASMVRRQRQTVMFSATWPESIQKLASEFLHHPVRVTIGSEDLAACRSVSQIVEVLDDNRQKDGRLLALLREYHKSRANKVLVFVLYKKEAARVESTLRRSGWSCCAIHGDMSQAERTRAFESFKRGERPLLIATDVAARGLDIPDVEFVLNYTFPLTVEDYVHRIGRTGRAGKKGTAHTLFTKFDKAHAGALVNVLTEAGQPVPEALRSFGTHVKRKEHALYGHHYNANPSAAAPQKPTRITFED